MSDHVYEAMMAKDTLNDGEPLSMINYYVIGDDGTWQGPFESPGAAHADATMRGRVVGVKTSTLICGRIAEEAG